jgi:hypothetical protein
MRNAFSRHTDTAFRLGSVGLVALGACSLAWNQFGSILARDWLPYAVAAALVSAGLLWSARAQRPSTPAVIGLLGLLGLAAWDAISLDWSPVPALARDEALLVVFYALAFAVPLLVLRTESDRWAATAVVVAFLIALAVAAMIQLLVGAGPTDHYENGRLTFPISYVNAQAALFLVGVWPCVALASRRSNRALLRGAAIGGACALLAGGLMTQSKGGLIAFSAAGVLFFWLNPSRLRAVVPALIPLALVGGSYELLTRPYRDRYGPDFADAIRFASAAALIIAGTGAVAGCVYALIDERVSMPQRAQRFAGVVLLAALGAALVGSVAAFFVTVDRPGHFFTEKWRSFKTLPAHESGSSHLTSLGSNRYDFWRVEIRDFAHHPLAGIGARGFGSSYLLRRRSPETPARGHSLALDTLSETGVLGFALLLVGLGSPFIAAARRAPRSLLASGLFAGAAAWLAHASVDWIWTVPAVGLPFFLLLGIAVAGDGERRLSSTRAIAPLGLAALALGLFAFGPPWLSARYTTRALHGGPSAAQDLRWAKRLDPLAIEPLIAESTFAPSQGARIAALRQAVGKEPRAAGLRYLLGRAYLDAGRRREARDAFLAAAKLDPHDELIRTMLRKTLAPSG